MSDVGKKSQRGDQTIPLLRTESKAPKNYTLVVASGSKNEQRVTIGQKPLIIGNSSDCDVVVDDPAVSRKHCELYPSPLGLRVRDLDSRNGTLVGGITIADALVYEGVVISIGNTEMFYTSDSDHFGDTSETPMRFGDAVGTSAAMRRVFALLTRIAPTDLTVTLIGETGTGKDVLARGIHAASLRHAAPFEVFDSGAVAPTLIESKLFGHIKGAFTGAVDDHVGAFESADQGTIFLDEIGELNLELQPKLLRVLEERRVMPVGGQKTKAVDVRVIAATNRDLVTEVGEGRFREDLYFRLGVMVVRVPPLRERREDIPLLVDTFLNGASEPMSCSEEALRVLKNHAWPGNVRELRNVVASAIAVSTSDVLRPEDFLMSQGATMGGRAKTLDGLPLGGRSLESIEEAAIRQTLERFGGNKTKTAKALGIATSTLYEKLKKYEP